MARQVKRRVMDWCERTGLPPDECTDVLVCTLTRGAAAEAASRDIIAHPKSIATLHAHCYRALGCPTLFTTEEVASQFNDWVSGECKRPEFVVSPIGAERRGGEGGDGARPGDQFMEQHQLLRSRLQDPVTTKEPVRPIVRDFARLYTLWKKLEGVFDFADCIEQCYLDDVEPAGCPTVIFVDEAQDNDALEVRTINRWAEQCEHVVYIGDPDQAVYAFRGGSAYHLIHGQYASSRVLDQSYRVPRGVIDQAKNIRHQIRDKIEDAIYHPRDADGQVVRFYSESFRYGADALVQDADRHYLSHGKTVMFIATTNYLVSPIVSALRRAGIKFHNPQASSNGTWNPYTPAKGRSVLDRLRAFLVASQQYSQDVARIWTASEMLSWAEWVRAEGVLARGAKARLKKMCVPGDVRESPLELDTIRDLMVNEDEFRMLAEVNPQWWVTRAMPAHERKIVAAVEMLERRGLKEIDSEPLCTVGTIHSIKGGESDAVYVCPALSPSFNDEYQWNPDSIHRLFYVAVTRARETLVLCGSEGEQEYAW